MSTLNMKVIYILLIAVVIFISGYWLHNSGKPYSALVLTLHKLISFGIFVYISVLCYQLNRLSSFPFMELTFCILMILAFLFAVISGGLLSTGRLVPSILQMIHRISSIAAAVFTGILIYLLRVRL